MTATSAIKVPARQGTAGDWNPAELQSRLDTRLITRRHPEYEQARQIYNRWHDLYPGAIVRTKDVQELRSVVAYAAAEGIELAIRGGGHHIGGFGSSDGGIVIDFSTFRAIEIDTAMAVAHVEPGARLGDMDRATCAVGRVIPTGTVSDTGIAGLTLGGGIGWLVGQYGLTCDHLVGADVLLADGRVVRAEDAEHRALLWALRGGGGNFGIVLRFRYALQPLPPTYCGSLIISWNRAREALVRLVAYLEDECPPTLTVAPTIFRSGDTLQLSVDFCCSAPIPDEIVASLVTAVGPAEQRDCRSWNFVEWQSHFDQAFQPPMRGYWKARYTRTLSQETLLALCDAIEVAPSSHCSVLIEHLHGSYRERAREHAAFSHRDMSFGVLLSARWEDALNDERIVGWLRAIYGSVLADASSSCYLNYTMDHGSDAVREVTGSALDRLTAVKQAYDPANLFRRNHNLRQAVR